MTFPPDLIGQAQCVSYFVLSPFRSKLRLRDVRNSLSISDYFQYFKSRHFSISSSINFQVSCMSPVLNGKYEATRHYSSCLFHSQLPFGMATELSVPSPPRPGPTRILAGILDELGLRTVWRSSLDVKLLCAQRFVRLFAYGGSTLILASYLSSLDISDEHIGLFMTLTLAGDVIISFFLTLFADAMGRKAVLALGSALMAGSGVVFALCGNFWILLAAAVFGVISPRYVDFLFPM